MTLSVKDFGAIGDLTADDAPAIQAAIDSLAEQGGTVLFPSGNYRIDSMLVMRSGVNLIGEGSDYRLVDNENVFSGPWLYYRGSAATPAIRFRSVADIDFWGLGINCVEDNNQTAIEIGSDNNPATKKLSFRRMQVLGATLAVQWGLGDALSGAEQCDDIVFDEIGIYSCYNGFLVNATNAADFSRIVNCTFGNLTGIGFNLKTPGFMRIENCAAAMLAGATMFKVSGSSPDPVRITGCQSEGPGVSTFLDYTAANDQGQLILHGNVINQPMTFNGIVRVVSAHNYINTTVVTTGFVRWRSYDDVWDGVFGQLLNAPQVSIGAGGQFYATTLKNAVSFKGSNLPVGFRILNGNPKPGGVEGMVITRAGILCDTFIAGGSYVVGQSLQPTTNNDHAYVVTAAPGLAGVEPTWPTTSGATVTSGGVTLKEAGQNALTADYGFMPAVGAASFDPPLLAVGGWTIFQVPCFGAALGGFAAASFSQDLQGLTVTAWVSSADTVNVRFQNDMSSSVDLTAGIVRVSVVNPS